MKTLVTDVDLSQVMWKSNGAFTTHHNGKSAGQIVKLHHICRVCWSKSKEKKFHKAGAEECQFTNKD